MFPAIPLDVSGRGKLTAAAQSNPHGVTIRMADAKNLEFWAHVRLTKEQLAELLEQVEAEQSEPRWKVVG